jgi:hypothetical protein
MTYSAESLDKLARIAQQLNAETDDLKNTVEGLDKTLGKMKLGVSVWLDELIEDGAASELKGYKLGYAKVKDKWRIAVQGVAKKGAATEAPTVALSKAPRLVKVHAVSRLDDLLGALTERAEAFLVDIREARGTAEAVRGEEPKAAETEEKPLIIASPEPAPRGE